MRNEGLVGAKGGGSGSRNTTPSQEPCLGLGEEQPSDNSRVFKTFPLQDKNY